MYAEATGIVALGETDYVIDIRHSPITTKYVLTLKTEKLPIFSLISAIGASFLPGDLQTLLEVAINILDATISYLFGVESQQLLVSGMPQHLTCI